MNYLLQKIRRGMALLLSTILLLSLININSMTVRAEDKPFKDVIESISMTLGDKGPELIKETGDSNNYQLIDKESKLFFNMKLNYDPTKHLELGEGAKHKITFEQPGVSEPGNNFVKFTYVDSQINRMVDENDVKIADIDMIDKSSIGFTFTDKTGSSFKASFKDLKMELNQDAVAEYFKAHPEAQEVDFSLNIKVDGENYKRLDLKVKRPPEPTSPEKSAFLKTSGFYEEPEEQHPNGSMLYNLRIDTRLNKYNEMVIYDAPDIFQSLDTQLSIYNGTRTGQLAGGNMLASPIYGQKNNKYVEPDSEDPNPDTKMMIEVYDVYYVTGEPANENSLRQAEWEAVDYTFTDRTYKDEEFKDQGPIQSSQKVARPKNILFEKPAYEKLTEEEQKKIEEAGGLYKKVGKGFKVRVKNFKGKLDKGGYLTFTYNLDIHGNSPEINSQGFQMYKNEAAYTGQEIPSKPSDKDTLLKENGGYDTTTNRPTAQGVGLVKPGSVGAELGPDSAFIFKKLEKDDNPEVKKPVKGAKFNIYEVGNDGSQKIAKWRPNFSEPAGENNAEKDLEGLITDENGELQFPDGQKVTRLIRGNYVFIEVDAPEGYEFEPGSEANKTKVTVGFSKVPNYAFNKKKPDALVLNSEDIFKVKKVLNGREFRSGDSFTFKYETNGEYVPLVHKDGVIVDTVTVTNGEPTPFDGTITFTEPNTYIYRIHEEAGNLKNVTYSKEEIEVKIVVTEENGALKAKVVYPNEGDTAATFTNTYAPNSVTIGKDQDASIKVQKVLEGRAFADGDSFEFTVTPKDNAPAPAETKVTVTNGEAVSLSDITFTKAGTYTYEISEVKGNIPNVTYDNATVTVTVNVVDENGSLKATVAYSQEGKNAATFTNTYAPNSVTIGKDQDASIKVQKVLEGRAFADGDSFEFTVTPKDNAPAPAETKVTVTNGEAVSLSDITFTKAGTYTYEISEVKGNIPNVTYDEKVITVKVEVVDEDGNLKASVKYSTGEEAAIFTNVYKKMEGPTNPSGGSDSNKRKNLANTGVDDELLELLLMMGISIASISLFYTRRKEK